jgi:hypothetical protein
MRDDIKLALDNYGVRFQVARLEVELPGSGMMPPPRFDGDDNASVDLGQSVCCC